MNESSKNYILEELIKTRRQLRSWFNTDLGRDLINIEQYRLSKVLPGLFGYHLLQLGHLGQDNLLTGSRIGHKIILDLDLSDTQIISSKLVSDCHSIPIASDSMDVVLLPHLLEFDTNPHQVLRETGRILIGEGHLIILGFNPWSWWGIWRVLLGWSEKLPFTGHYVGLPRLKDWLALLDFEIIKIEKFYFRPPFKNITLMEKIGIIEKIGRYCWPFFGGVFLLVAKKRVAPLTPVKMQWRARRHMINSGFAEPSTRG